MQQAEISVIIPVHNAAPFLRGCLDALMAQTQPDFEVTCVSDCCRPTTIRTHPTVCVVL